MSKVILLLLFLFSCSNQSYLLGEWLFIGTLSNGANSISYNRSLEFTGEQIKSTERTINAHFSSTCNYMATSTEYMVNNCNYEEAFFINFIHGICVSLQGLPYSQGCRKSEIKAYIEAQPETNTYKYEVTLDTLKITYQNGNSIEYKRPEAYE